MTNEIHFCTFGSLPDYKRALERIRKQAAGSGYFNKVHTYTQSTLPQLKEHAAFVKKNPRGYGYWIWKPLIMLDMLKKTKVGDIIVYADAGCGIYSTEQAKTMFMSYIEKIRASPHGRLCFTNGHMEGAWTKGDLFELMDLRNGTYTDTPQVMSGIQIIINNDDNAKFYTEYINISTSNGYHYIDDSPSISPNQANFVEHRHDQSIFSLLIKKYGGTILSPPGKSTNVPIATIRSRKA